MGTGEEVAIKIIYKDYMSKLGAVQQQVMHKIDIRRQVRHPHVVCILEVMATESASSPLVGFGELNDNIIKGLTSLLSVEQEIKFIAYTCGLRNDKYIQGLTSRQT
jgi:serine/threonine protein kinase